MINHVFTSGLLIACHMQVSFYFLTIFAHSKKISMKKVITQLLTLLLMTSVLASPATAASFPSSEPSPNTAKTEPTPQSVNAALDEFKSLSRHERKTRIKEAKKLMKEYRADKRSGRAAETDQVLLAILAILLPPLAVYLKEGEVNSRFWISLILTLLFWIPGVIFALLVVFDAI
jgi:uncharacterized membrane protein YqaE (UPF0057 family)